MKNIKLSKFKLILSYIIIWLIPIATFWMFSKDGDAMGYSITVLWFLIPILIFITSFIIGKEQYWGKYKWISSIFFGITYMLSEYLTFSLYNNITFDKLNIPEWPMLISGIIISIAGIVLGQVIGNKK